MYNNRNLPWLVVWCRAAVVYSYISIAALLVSCGSNEDQQFEINGELKSCSVIETQDCGLTLACDGDGFYQCVSN